MQLVKDKAFLHTVNLQDIHSCKYKPLQKLHDSGLIGKLYLSQLFPKLSTNLLMMLGNMGHSGSTPAAANLIWQDGFQSIIQQVNQEVLALCRYPFHWCKVHAVVPWECNVSDVLVEDSVFDDIPR